MPLTSAPTANKSPNVAIVGGGLIGVMLGLGLLHRGIPFTIYERAPDWHEIGAGVALTSVARSSMQRLHPLVLAALRRVAKANHFGFWDGFHPPTKEAAQAPEALHFLLDAPGTDYWCCMRSQFLRELVALLPAGSTRFNKELESYVDDPSRQQILLRFTDGTTAEADACRFPVYALHSVLTLQKYSAVTASIHGLVNSFWEMTTRQRTLVSPISSATAPCSLSPKLWRSWAMPKGVATIASILAQMPTYLPTL